MTHSSDSDVRQSRCGICSQLADHERAFQKGGREEEATYLPAAWRQLELLRDFKPGSSRARQLLRCRECGTCYLYTSDYEFLVNGTEDEEFLDRLTGDEAAKEMLS